MIAFLIVVTIAAVVADPQDITPIPTPTPTPTPTPIFSPAPSLHYDPFSIVYIVIGVVGIIVCALLVLLSQRLIVAHLKRNEYQEVVNN